ncbi:MAG: hypothetical protein V4543_00780 [Bacteroidota bacterium]
MFSTINYRTDILRQLTAAEKVEYLTEECPNPLEAAAHGVIPESNRRAFDILAKRPETEIHTFETVAELYAFLLANKKESVWISETPPVKNIEPEGSEPQIHSLAGNFIASPPYKAISLHISEPDEDEDSPLPNPLISMLGPKLGEPAAAALDAFFSFAKEEPLLVAGLTLILLSRQVNVTAKASA